MTGFKVGDRVALMDPISHVEILPYGQAPGHERIERIIVSVGTEGEVYGVSLDAVGKPWVDVLFPGGRRVPLVPHSLRLVQSA
jgi:hypothetical protein